MIVLAEFSDSNVRVWSQVCASDLIRGSCVLLVDDGCSRGSKDIQTDFRPRQISCMMVMAARQVINGTSKLVAGIMA